MEDRMAQLKTTYSKKLGIVIPTTGNLRTLSRCINSIVESQENYLLTNSTFYIFYNKSDLNKQSIKSEVAQLFEKFPYIDWEIRVSEKFFLTAEESGLEATRGVTTEYIFLVGDKRIFLPEGMKVLSNWLENEGSESAYFNSLWGNQDGINFGQVSTIMNSEFETFSYKELVMKMGLNFMPTAMGAWVYKTKFLDSSTWSEVIAEAGGHFSHVTTLLITMGKIDVIAFSTPLFMAEQKNYHTGDVSEWSRYAKLTGNKRYYPWTGGLIKHFKLLIEKEVFTIDDIRKCMCNEIGLPRRQINEILNFLTLQVLLGRKIKSERFSEAEFEDYIDFIRPIIPERKQIIDILSDLFLSKKVSIKNESQSKERILASINQDYSKIPFSTLIVSRIKNSFIRLHPNGYLVSTVSDTKCFIDAYRILDSSSSNQNWSIAKSFDDAIKLAYDSKNNRPIAMVEAPVTPSLAFAERRKTKLSRCIFRFRISYILNDKLPESTIKTIKKILGI
jgi:hypothetical protein